MKKNLIRISIASVLALALFWGAKTYLFPTQAGSKSVEVIVSVAQESGDPLVVLDTTVKTDALTFGDLLDEISTKENIVVQYAGTKTDTYGRYITGIGQYVTTDSAKGPWWLIDSKTNKDCLSAGFCNGIDLQSVYDQDIFTLNFSSSY